MIDRRTFEVRPERLAPYVDFDYEMRMARLRVAFICAMKSPQLELSIEDEPWPRCKCGRFEINPAVREITIESSVHSRAGCALASGLIDGVHWK